MKQDINFSLYIYIISIDRCTLLNIFSFCFSDVKIFYQEDHLPDVIRLRMPMLGSREIFTEHQNLVRIPKTMFVYKICLDIEKCNTSAWTDLGYNVSPGDTLGFISVNGSNVTSNQGTYLRILPAGSYHFDNLASATLLFFHQYKLRQF